ASDLLMYADSTGTGLALIGDFDTATMNISGTVTEAWFSFGWPLPGFHITGASFFMTTSFYHDELSGSTVYWQEVLNRLLQGADTVIGSEFNDVLTGLGGDDILIGGGGADKLIGGAGVNTASYVSAPAGLFAGIGAAAFNTGEAAGDSYSG